MSALARDRSINFCKLRTFLRSPACDAVKMRCRRRRTSPSTRGQSIDPQSRASPSGPFTSAAVPLWRPTCPSVPGLRSSSSSQAHLTRVSTLSGPGSCPYPASSARRPAEGPASCPGFLSPFGHRHSLPRSSVPRWGDWAFLTVGLPAPARGPDPIGVPTFHTHEMRPGWVPPVSRGRRCSPGRLEIPGRRLPLLSGQSLHPAPATHRPRLTHNETSTEVHAIHPSGLPLARDPRMEQGSFGFPPSFAPRRYQRRTSRVGPGHRAQAWDYASGIGRSSNLRVRSLRATSCRTFFLVSTLITGWPSSTKAWAWPFR